MSRERDTVREAWQERLKDLDVAEIQRLTSLPLSKITAFLDGVAGDLTFEDVRALCEATQSNLASFRAVTGKWF